VIALSFQSTDFHQVLGELATLMGTTLEDGILRIPERLGTGFVRAVTLPNGLSMLMTDNTVTDDLRFQRMRTDKSNYVLGLDEIRIAKNLTYITDRDSITNYPPIFAGVYLNSTLLDNVVISSRNNHFRGVRVIFDTAWMMKYLGIRKDDEVLRKYISLKARKFTLEPMDEEYRTQMNEIIDADPTNPLYATILENRIMMLIERFFSRLAEQVRRHKTFQVNNDDFFLLMEVEKAMVNDFSRTPPTIDELSKRYSVGSSKLKRQFKQVYGIPIYEYYQKYRMEKAKDLLLSGDFAVKEVGYRLGYQNLSNFANAFKKEFGVLPSEVVNQSAG
jgi:AraC-like DNA-binding protein